MNTLLTPPEGRRSPPDEHQITQRQTRPHPPPSLLRPPPPPLPTQPPRLALCRRSPHSLGPPGVLPFNALPLSGHAPLAGHRVPRAVTGRGRPVPRRGRRPPPRRPPSKVISK